MRKLWILAGIAVMATACSDEKTPLAPTAIASPAPPLATPPLPTTVPGVLAISMPIDPGDAVNTTFGMEPFGYHGPDHAQDGHAGWDIEYRPGAVVRAAAAGTIQSVNENSLSPGRFSVIIEHVVGEHFYRTIYTNLVNLPSDTIAPDEVVFANQPLGSPGPSGTPGTSMIHFQLEDLEFHREGFSSPKAVTPESFLSAPAKSIFDALWSRAIFDAELVEPFATNSRQVSPISRTWTRVGGDGPAGIRFTRVSPGIVEYHYELLAESGVVIETGAVAINTIARPYALIALTAPTQVRLGLYDIVSNEMRLALALPGAPRATDLSGAATYRTTR